MSTPESSSVALRVTSALVMNAPSEFLSPATTTEVSGGVLSCDGGSTTVKSTAFSSAALPDLSVAR